MGYFFVNQKLLRVSIAGTFKYLYTVMLTMIKNHPSNLFNSNFMFEIRKTEQY